MADDFFKEKPDEEEKAEEEIEGEEEEKEEPEKIKIGKEEYTQEELASLVSLGKIGKEAEDKFKTKIDKVWPEYTKTRQELKELKGRLEKEEKERIEKKALAGEGLSEEEQIKQTLTQADKIGLITKENVRNYIMQVLEARDLLDSCSDLQTEVDGSDGRPPFKTQEVLDHMNQSGIRNPEKAYKDLYEEQLDKWKEDQLKKAKPKGLVTGEGSAIGGKEPPQVKVTRDNLGELIEESLRGNI